jgi:hypothetical protein
LRHLSGLCGDRIGELAYAFELGGVKALLDHLQGKPAQALLSQGSSDGRAPERRRLQRRVPRA